MEVKLPGELGVLGVRGEPRSNASFSRSAETVKAKVKVQVKVKVLAL